MRKIIFMTFLLACLTGEIHAQETKEKEKFTPDTPIWEELTNMKKKTDKFNLSLYMRGGFDTHFQRGFQEGKFRMNDLRIEAKGNINHWLSYHYRQRLNRSNDGSNREDNLPASIDYAYIGVKLNQRTSLLLGKHSAFYGGMEFDQNPIEVYEFSDMGANTECFLTGVNLSYQLTPKHEINLQVLNNRNASFRETYGVVVDENGEMPDLKDSKLPLVYNINWNANYNNVVKTRYSAAILSETKGHRMYYYALGNELNLNKWHAFVDFMYSKEGIDRTGIITGIVGRPQGYNMTDVSYLSLVAQCNYRFLPKWHVFAKGMYETASVDKNSEYASKGKYRTSWGYLGGIEFYPMESNLHFFLTYVGRTYDFTSKAVARGQKNYDTHRISVGFIWKMPVF